MAGAITRGVLFVHSAPRALCPHVEWAAGNVLGTRTTFDWTAQPAGPGFYRAEHSWQGAQGTGARLASALRGWAHLRYEITEEASHGVDGSRWSHTPELGIFHAATDVHGNIVVPEDRIRAALEHAADPAAPAQRARPRARAGVGRRAGAVPLRRRGRAGPLAAPGRLTRQRLIASLAHWTFTACAQPWTLAS